MRSSKAPSNSGTRPWLRLALAGSTLALLLVACGQVAPIAARSAVVQGVTGSATLTWTPVTQTTAGDILTGLGGYRVFYGSSPDALTTTVNVTDPNQTSYLISPLSPGTWYFAVAAFTNEGVQGEMSNVASKTINNASQ
jgi:hypothetical protein